jgi:hypothetical protein
MISLCELRHSCHHCSRVSVGRQRNNAICEKQGVRPPGSPARGRWVCNTDSHTRYAAICQDAASMTLSNGWRGPSLALSSHTCTMHSINGSLPWI